LETGKIHETQERKGDRGASTVAPAEDRLVGRAEGARIIGKSESTLRRLEHTDLPAAEDAEESMKSRSGIALDRPPSGTVQYGSTIKVVVARDGGACGARRL
jgi:hypothetical protein